MKGYDNNSGTLSKSNKPISLKEIWPSERQDVILTTHEFGDMATFLSKENEEPTTLVKGKDKLTLPKRFSLQAYVEPKLDGRYIAYFNDETNDRIKSLWPNV